MQEAILGAILRFARQSTGALEVLKQHVGMGLAGVASDTASGDDPYTLRARIAGLDARIDALYIRQRQGPKESDAGEFETMYREKAELKERLTEVTAAAEHAGAERSRLDEIFAAVDGLRDRSLAWDEGVIRQMVECVKVLGKDRLAIRFRLGVEVEVEMGDSA